MENSSAPKYRNALVTSLLLGSVSVLALAHAAMAASTASVTPGQSFNLSHWNLQLPLPNGESVLEIASDKLTGGYTSSYFSTGADQSMTFWCPVTGATTEHSHYPRSELRESTGDWTLDGHHEFSAVCRVLAVPSNGRIIIGQIHGNLTGSEMVKLLWDNGTVEARVEPDRDSETGLSLGSYKLGDTLRYKIEMTKGIAKVTLNGKSVTYSYTAATWKTDKYYFKAGAYVQDNVGSSSEGGKVAFYSLGIPSTGTTGLLDAAPMFGERKASAPRLLISSRTGWRPLYSGAPAVYEAAAFDPMGRVSLMKASAVR